MKRLLLLLTSVFSAFAAHDLRDEGRDSHHVISALSVQARQQISFEHQIENIGTTDEGKTRGFTGFRWTTRPPAERKSP